MSPRPLAILCAALAAVASCSPSPVESARDRAVRYFETEVAAPDPRWSDLFGYMHRRFGLEVELANGTSLHTPSSVGREGIGAVYDRLSDPSATVTVRQVAELPTAVDRIVATALHCDRIPIPENWSEILLRAAEKGGYALTHSVLAAEWTIENQCLPWNALASLHEAQVGRLEALVEHRDDLVGGASPATDIWIEALVMLYYSGAGSRVRPEWIDALLDAQRPDGGWPLHPDADRSDPHPTALALWVLLENAQPDTAPIRWVPPR